MIPSELVLQNSQYRAEMQGINVPRDIYANISGTRASRPTGRGGRTRRSRCRPRVPRPAPPAGPILRDCRRGGCPRRDRPCWWPR
ncbi:MAG: hypothetical protein ACKPBG_09980 [Actinomycetota bacterium]